MKHYFLYYLFEERNIYTITNGPFEQFTHLLFTKGAAIIGHGLAWKLGFLKKLFL